jgi:hypothetical protein
MRAAFHEVHEIASNRQISLQRPFQRPAGEGAEFRGGALGRIEIGFRLLWLARVRHVNDSSRRLDLIAVFSRDFGRFGDRWLPGLLHDGLTGSRRFRQRFGLRRREIPQRQRDDGDGGDEANDGDRGSAAGLKVHPEFRRLIPV